MASWRPGRLALNTAHAGGWNFTRIALQAASLVLMARALGAEGYGALAGTVALYATFAQFVGMGSGIALVRHLARAGELYGRLSATQRTYFVTSVMLFAMGWPLSVGVLGAVLAPMTLACLAAAELVFAPMLLPLAYRYLAEERMLVSGALLTLVPFARFGAVLCALVMDMHDVAAFALLYLGWVAAVVISALCLAWPRGGLAFSRPTLTATVREGLPYIVSGAAATASGELDKTILLHLAGSVITGHYAAAYRIMQAATLPVNSLILAASPRMFRSSNDGKSAGVGTLYLAILSYAVIAAVLLWLAAPFAHVVLGQGFLESDTYLRGLCLVLVVNCMRQLATAQLTTSDLQKNRNLIEIAGLCISLILMLSLVPLHKAWGAMVALGISDLLVVAMAGTLMLRRNMGNSAADRHGLH